jgi:hypothetical protein
MPGKTGFVQWFCLHKELSVYIISFAKGAPDFDFVVRLDRAAAVPAERAAAWPPTLAWATENMEKRSATEDKGGVIATLPQ